MSGAWVMWIDDDELAGRHVEIHAGELEALRAALKNGGGHYSPQVTFVPFGMSVDDAVSAQTPKQVSR